MEYQPKRLLDQMLEMAQSSLEHHEKRFLGDWFWYYKHYKNYVDRRISQEDYHSNIGLGLAYPIVEIVHARLMEPWMAGEAILKATAYEDEYEDGAPASESLVNDHLRHRVSRSFSKHSLLVKSALLYGRAVMKPYGKRTIPRQRLRRKVVSIMGIPLDTQVAREMVPAGVKPWFDFIDPFDWWLWPGARWLEESEGCWERGYFSHASALQRIASGEWLPVPTNEEEALGYDEWRQKRLDLEANFGDQVRSTWNVGFGVKRSKPHRYIEYQGLVEVRDDPAAAPRMESRRVGVLDDKHIVLNQPLDTYDGGPDYIEWCANCDPSSERPVGLIEPIEEALLEANSLESIALDNARKIMESPLAVDWTQTRQNKIYLGPAEVNWIRNPTASIAPIPMRDLPNSFYQQIGFLNDLMQRISGVSDYFGGLNTADTSRVSQTATGMELMTRLSATRFGPLMLSLDQEYYSRMGNALYQMSRLYLNEPMTLPNPDASIGGYMTFNPAEMEGEYLFHFHTRVMDPTSEQRRENFVRLAKHLVDLAPMMLQNGYRVDYHELVRVMFREFDRGEDARKIVQQITMGPGGVPVLPNGMPVPMQPHPDQPLAAAMGPSLPGRPAPEPN